MKILQIIPNLMTGGAERFVVDLCNTFYERKHEVILILFFADDKKEQLLLQQLNTNIRVIFMNKKPGFDFSMFKKLGRTIRQLGPQVIHTHTGGFTYLAPLSCFFRNDIAVFHTIHSDAFKETEGRLGYTLRKFFFRKKNVHPVTISNESRDSFYKAYPGVHQDMIYNGRATEKPSVMAAGAAAEINGLKENIATRIFLFIGRLTSVKNPQRLIRSFKRLKNDGADAILVLIGRAAEEDIYQEILAEQGKNGVYYLGEKTNVLDYLQLGNFFCISSEYEGMPISLIEAFAAGLVPVSTPVGGVPGLIKDVGFLSPSVGDETGYYHALKEAYSLSPGELQTKSAQVREEYKRKFTMDICADAYTALYQKYKGS